MGLSGPWPQVLLKQSGTGGWHVVPVVHEVVLRSLHGAEPQRAGIRGRGDVLAIDEVTRKNKHKKIKRKEEEEAIELRWMMVNEVICYL
ncbi:hypothetical protein L1987_89714 [Smallanthus sonchifolius]|nr:hypothetical protein L1987_89712 [Smallanthus sonchifolius]KAI3664530.1 hypothetical protein L1987_89714 [Smallanthus sonchifolius]